MGRKAKAVRDERRTMDVEEFVKETLLQVLAGTAAAQAKLPAPGGHRWDCPAGEVNPVYQTTEHDRKFDVPVAVQFDVAVCVTRAKEQGGGVGLSVIGAGLGGGATVSEDTTNVSRVKFVVPVRLPRCATRAVEDPATS